MPRPLSNPEWAAFMDSPNPNTLAFPPWGGIVNWAGSGQYILCYKMPSGEWALSDITDGIPDGAGNVIPVQNYLQTLGSAKYTDAGDVFWNTLPDNFLQAAVQLASSAGALLTEAGQVAAQVAPDVAAAIGNTLKNLLQGPLQALTPSLFPIAIAAIVVLVLLKGK